MRQLPWTHHLIILGQCILTHHNLRNLGKRTLPLNVGDKPLLDPIAESGSGMLQEPQRVYMTELIEKLNELFGGETTDQD